MRLHGLSLAFFLFPDRVAEFRFWSANVIHFAAMAVGVIKFSF